MLVYNINIISGADISQRNNTGETALTLARRGNHDQLGIYLAEILVDKEEKDKIAKGVSNDEDIKDDLDESITIEEENADDIIDNISDIDFNKQS